MKPIVLFFIKTLVYSYRFLISPVLRPKCRFLPTCSQYALDALDHYGPYKGSLLTLKRLFRCHPWGGHGFDPVRKDDQ